MSTIICLSRQNPLGKAIQAIDIVFVSMLGLTYLIYFNYFQWRERESF